MRYKAFGSDKLTPIWVIMIINLLVFIGTLAYQLLGTEAYNQLIRNLGLAPAIFPNQPWTIITSMFTHASFWHILMNMLALYFYGSFLSRLVGIGKFLIIYFCGGLLGNIFFLLLAPPYVIGIGASGAIFALGGALALLTPNLRVYIFPLPIAMPLWVAVIGGFLILSFVPGIAWQAHLGGLVFGLISGFFIRKRSRIIY